MSLLDSFATTPDVLIIRRDICGWFPFPDETVRPFRVLPDHIAVRQCHCYHAPAKTVDGAVWVSRGDGILVFLAKVCVDDPGMTVVSVAQYTVAAAVGATVGSGIMASEDEPWDAHKGSCLAAIILQPDVHAMHKFGNPVTPSAFRASKKKFPPEEIARLLAAFEAHVLADLAAGTGC